MSIAQAYLDCSSGDAPLPALDPSLQTSKLDLELRELLLEFLAPHLAGCGLLVALQLNSAMATVATKTFGTQVALELSGRPRLGEGRAARTR